MGWNSTCAGQRVWRDLGVSVTLLLLTGSARADQIELITNGDFDEDQMLTGWTVAPGADASWDFDDVDGGTGSARLALFSQVATFGVALRQCIDVSPGDSLEGSGWVRVISGASDNENRGELRMSWHTGDDCTGESPGGTIIGGSSELGNWTPFSNTIEVPAGIESATVSAVVVQNNSGSGFIFQLDAVSVLPEPDAAASAFAALAALAVLGRRQSGAAGGTA